MMIGLELLETYNFYRLEDLRTIEIRIDGIFERMWYLKDIKYLMKDKVLTLPLDSWYIDFNLKQLVINLRS